MKADSPEGGGSGQKELAGSGPAVVADVPQEPDPSHVLTWRQQQILRVIREWADRRGYAPTMREIAEEVGLTSKSSVAHHLSLLQKKGYLRRYAGRPRTVEIRSPGDHVRADMQPTGDDAATDCTSQEAVSVPFIGQIAAGAPMISEQVIGGPAFLLPRQLVGEGDLFLLQVAGDSMMNAGIFDGDWVVVRTQSAAEDGEIVAAVIDGVEVEATVKTYRRVGGGHVWLMPHNPAYAPIPGDDAVIAGKVVALLRRM